MRVQSKQMTYDTKGRSIRSLTSSKQRTTCYSQHRSLGKTIFSLAHQNTMHPLFQEHDVVQTFHELFSALILTSAAIFARGFIPDTRTYRQLQEVAAA